MTEQTKHRTRILRRATPKKRRVHVFLSEEEIQIAARLGLRGGVSDGLRTTLQDYIKQHKISIEKDD